MSADQEGEASVGQWVARYLGPARKKLFAMREQFISKGLSNGSIDSSFNAIRRNKAVILSEAANSRSLIALPKDFRVTVHRFAKEPLPWGYKTPPKFVLLEGNKKRK